MPRRTIALLACLVPLTAANQAVAKGPDRAFKTPIAHGAAAAQTAVSGKALRKGLARAWKGTRGGAWVAKAGSNQILFRRKSGKARLLASNMKLFTTSAALARFGPGEHLQTTAWSSDDVSDGIATTLYLRGAGDPTLSTAGLSRLASRVRAAGVFVVQNPLVFDDSFLDLQTDVPQTGIRHENVGNLSALVIDNGRTREPAPESADRFLTALRQAGVQIPSGPRRGTTPPESAGVRLVGSNDSPTLAELAKSTNVPSDNYLAEMLTKVVGGKFGGNGSTAGGVAEVKNFAGERGATLKAENGSGLSRRDAASPGSVGRLIDSMLVVDEGAATERQLEQQRLRDGFVNSLAVAGRSGTVAHRMRGTAARDNCHVKTGTLSGVSALSGVCFKGANDEEHGIVFSLLMSGDVNRAHRVQDRMAALIARAAG